MSDGSVNIKDLVKTYTDDRGRPTFTAVKNINLNISNGEFMVLVGPSGCGKTTTLRMVAGLEKISSGTISIGGRVVNDLEPKDRGIAMVFQNYALYPHMTIFNNMAFGLQLAKKKKDFIQETVTRTSKALGLDQMLERKPQALVRRTTSASGSRARDRAQSHGLPFRRTALEPRCEDARADAFGDFATPWATGLDHDLRHPRPGRSDDHGRPDLRHAGRPDHAGRRSIDPLSKTGEPLCRRLYRQPSHESSPRKNRAPERRSGLR